MNDKSFLISRFIGFMYPIILLIGVYIIVNGHQSPGGGFHGGAVLATVFICRYLENPNQDLRIHYLEIFEKILFSLVLLLPVILLFNNISMNVISNKAYLLIMNILIGLKVCTGLSIIFYRFVFYEGGGLWN
jgi:multicomponent Na+:H+ antiporter subunit B